MPERFDLIVLGGGTAGLVTTVGATHLGARVLIAEQEALGGDCLWTGCVPSKALIASARAAHIRRDSGLLGLFGKSRPPDFSSVMSSMRQARESVSHHDDPERFRRMGVTVALGQAEFAGAETVRIGDRTCAARRIVIATGSRPAIPSIPGLEDAGYLTHLTVFDLENAPESVVLIGGGAIGVEFAQLFTRLNVPVTILETAADILVKEDPDAVRVVRRVLEGEGVAVESGVEIVRVESGGGNRTIVWRRAAGPEQRTTAGVIFVAAGRAPNTEGLCLDRIGVMANERGVVVDRHLATTRPGVWAAGDVSGGMQFTHVADYQARLVVRNALTPFRARADYRAIPWVTYTDPELARVGRTESEASALGQDPVVYRYELANLDRAMVERRTEGFVKLVATRRGRILGATIVASGAGELIVPIVITMQRGLSISALSSFVYPYPTMAEGVKRAADLAQRGRLDSPAGRLLKRLIRWRL